METENWYVQWLKENNLTRKEVFEQFGIPLRTQYNWSYNSNKCPDYVFNLLKFAVEHK